MTLFTLFFSSNRNFPVAVWVLPSTTLCYTARISRFPFPCHSVTGSWQIMILVIGNLLSCSKMLIGAAVRCEGCMRAPLSANKLSSRDKDCSSFPWFVWIIWCGEVSPWLKILIRSDYRDSISHLQSHVYAWKLPPMKQILTHLGIPPASSVAWTHLISR